MLRRAALIASLMLLAGCAHVLGYAGNHPGYVECKGKGVITGTGSLSIGAGAGGAGTNTFTLQADCGDGFTLHQGPAPEPATKP